MNFDYCALQNLFIKLGNLQGSTILPPTIVETYIVRVVGNPQPDVPRMKQLAQKITHSSSGNLGLNNTVFGKVKQIRLSSYLKHSLHSRGSSDAPSPAPMQHHGHHRHHHRHHGHEDNRHLAPAAAPIISPVHTPKHAAPPPSGCPYGKKAKNRVPVSPAAEPVANDPAASPPHPLSPSVRHPPRDPSVHSTSPVPSPPVLPQSPLPTVSFGDAHPPSDRPTSTGPPAGMPQVAPAPHSCELSFLFISIIGIDCYLKNIHARLECLKVSQGSEMLSKGS